MLSFGWLASSLTFCTGMKKTGSCSYRLVWLLLDVSPVFIASELVANLRLLYDIFARNQSWAPQICTQFPQPQIPQNCMRCSTTANPQVCDRFAVTFRTSATANAHCTSANLDHIIYCYFVFVMTFFIFEGQILPSTRR